MTEKEKAAKGLLYNANYDPELIREREAAKDILWEYHRLRPSQYAAREQLIRSLFGGIGEDTTSGQVWELVQASHAGYLYADETDEALKDLFAPYTEEFAWKTLYRIQINDGTLILERKKADRDSHKRNQTALDNIRVRVHRNNARKTLEWRTQWKNGYRSLYRLMNRMKK